MVLIVGAQAIMRDTGMVEHKVTSVALRRVDMEVVNGYSLRPCRAWRRR